ncbi:MAG: hypothetical protein KY476_02290 [Planctomycetes bacterium]|nr:hypothetical protein [Planctomycetota bacterium]
MLAASVLAGGLLETARVRAQDESEDATTLEHPLVVVSVASVNRLLGDVQYMFQMIERPEIFEALEGLVGNFGGLKGVDRDKPFGVMLFLESGLSLRPEPVGYVPVSSVDDLVRTATIGPVTFREVDKNKGRYEIVAPDETLQIQIAHGYAFIGRSEATIDRELPDPAALTQQLATRYDFAVRADLKTIPETARTLFLDYLRAETETNLQQRDGEDDAQYQARRLSGLTYLEIAEGVLNDGEDLTFGLDASKDQQAMVLEWSVNATPDSKFAKILTDLGGKYSRFNAALTADIPLSLTSSVNYKTAAKQPDTFIVRVAESLDVIERVASRRLQERGIDASPVAGIVKSLKATNEKGVLDAFVQFMGEPPGAFVLIGGIQVAQGQSLAAGLSGLIANLPEKPAGLELSVDSHNGVSFHRFTPPEVDGGLERVFGQQLAAYFGVGPDALWFAVGGADAMPTLRESMNRVAEAAAAGPPPRTAKQAPFRLVLHLGRWIAMMGTDERQRDPGRRISEDAFAKGNDTLTMELRPTEHGLRFQIQLEEGFLRLVGLGIARRYDRRRL